MNNQIIINNTIRHGKPTIKGTRITVEEVLGALAGGMNFEEIEKEYAVKANQIRSAIHYAASWFEGEKVVPLKRAKAKMII